MLYQSSTIIALLQNNFVTFRLCNSGVAHHTFLFHLSLFIGFFKSKVYSRPICFIDHGQNLRHKVPAPCKYRHYEAGAIYTLIAIMNPMAS